MQQPRLAQNIGKQGNYLKDRQQQGKAGEWTTVTGYSNKSQHSGIMGNHYSLTVWEAKVWREIRKDRTENFGLTEKSSSEQSSLKRFWSSWRGETFGNIQKQQG
jgi:hypothetical protein